MAEKKEITEQIMEKIAETMGGGEYLPKMDFMDDIGFSSLAVMELIAWAEDTFQIEITPRELRLIGTPEELAGLVEEKRGQHL